MLFGLSCSLIISFAQKNETGIIRGNVITSDGKAAESVSILFKNTTRGTITDETGNFEFRKIRPGKHVLVLSLSGFSQKEILSCLVEGMSYKMIASHCIISIETVNIHIKNIYKKLQVHSKSEAVVKAIRGKIV